MFYELENTLGGILDKESFQILDILRLRLWTALFNSNHRFLTISLCILLCVWGYYLAAKLHPPGRGNQVLGKISWYLVRFMTLLNLTRAPGPVEAK
jgi:hypothetical protein